jgi:hypothetical protein
MLTSWFFLSFSVKRGLRNERVVQDIIYRIYHRDFMPYLARIEGLINLLEIDQRSAYFEMVRAEIHHFRDHLKKILKE